MRVQITRLIELERAGALRWLKPYGQTMLDGRRPSEDAVADIEAPSGWAFTCRLISYHEDDVELAYTGPRRPREQLLELRALLAASR